LIVGIHKEAIMAELLQRISDLRYRVESFGSLGDQRELEAAEKELARLLTARSEPRPSLILRAA
jgi:hypothetical protein